VLVSAALPQIRSPVSPALQIDAAFTVTGATFTAWDQTGAQKGTHTVTLTEDCTLQQPPFGPVTAANLAPIAAFTFNIGGWDNGEAATLTSGAGTLTYQNPYYALSVENTKPDYTFDFHYTVETANLAFGPLPPTHAESIVQTFTAVAEQ
jgi:hypothetical protein